MTLASRDPLAPPIIDPRYLSEPGDRETLLAGIAICEDILQAPALRQSAGKHFLMPENSDSLSRGERGSKAITENAHTLYHPVGTARMGLDAASVVDEELRVRGVQGLRVVDASVMPMIIRGHTQAASYVIGEKGADLVLAAAREHSARHAANAMNAAAPPA